MATKYEYYNTGDDDWITLYGVTWGGQTFTPAIAHKISEVKLKLFRVGSPGTVTVSIRATDASGHPTGSDLCSGTIDGNSLTTDTAGDWYSISLGDGYDLAKDTKYAIVLRAPAGNPNNRPCIRLDASSPTYTGGCREWSSNSGGTWSSDTARDYMFEEWGNAVPNTPTNTSPSDGKFDLNLAPTLQSSAFSGDGAHTGSQWQITTTHGNYTSPVYDSGDDAANLTSIAVPAGNLETLTTYYWHVRHENEAGWSNYSTETSFTTRSATVDILVMKRACEEQEPVKRTDCPICAWTLEEAGGDTALSLLRLAKLHCYTRHKEK